MKRARYLNVRRGAWVLLAAAGVASGCARLPELVPESLCSSAEAERVCRGPFPQQPWRAVHALHISGPFGQKSSVVGVTIVEPASGRIRAVILSLEGLALFDASRHAGTVTVHRALPPLDRKGFPEGLMNDVSLLFLAPEGLPTETGRDPQGRLVCRWRDEHAGTTDLVTLDAGRWRILRYDSNRRPGREAEVAGAGPEEPGAAEVRFACHGLVPYAMDLTRIEAEFLDGEYETLFTEDPTP